MTGRPRELVYGAARSMDAVCRLPAVRSFLSTRPVPDPRRPGTCDFTLNQFNVLLSLGDEAGTPPSCTATPYNPAVVDGLPAPLRHPATGGLPERSLSPTGDLRRPAPTGGAGCRSGTGCTWWTARCCRRWPPRRSP
ncbi:MAG: 4Fe-4S ferredoxin, iron-sulfur binding [Modestobacter sp.]|nr:4Fe-4S ferredoxin, iron-sulfur binding [Modestobacter sp.]